MDSVPSQHLPDNCSAIVKASYTEKIQVLDAVDLGEGFKKALPLLMRQIEVSMCVCVGGGWTVFPANIYQTSVQP